VPAGDLTNPATIAIARRLGATVVPSGRWALFRSDACLLPTPPGLVVGPVDQVHLIWLHDKPYCDMATWVAVSCSRGIKQVG
jgi:hypothetical protein